MQISIRYRLVLSFWVTVLIYGFWWIHHSRDVFHSTLSDQIRLRSIIELKFVYWILNTPSGPDTVPQLQDLLRDLGSHLERRITYIAAGGHVIADSEISSADLPGLDNHASRPEFIQARTQDFGLSIRYSGTIETDMLYVATSVPGRHEIPAGVLRLAVPLTKVSLEPVLLNSKTIVVSALFLVATLLASFALTAGCHRSLKSLIQSVETLISGNTSHRFPLDVSFDLKPLAHILEKLRETFVTRLTSVEQRRLCLESIFEKMKEGVIILDRHGKIVAFNPALGQMMPEASRFIGRKPLEVFMSLELQSACDQLLDQTYRKAEERGGLRISISPSRIYKARVSPCQFADATGALLLFLEKEETESRS